MEMDQISIKQFLTKIFYSVSLFITIVNR